MERPNVSHAILGEDGGDNQNRALGNRAMTCVARIEAFVGVTRPVGLSPLNTLDLPSESQVRFRLDMVPLFKSAGSPARRTEQI